MQAHSTMQLLNTRMFVKLTFETLEVMDIDVSRGHAIIKSDRHVGHGCFATLKFILKVIEVDYSSVVLENKLK